MGHQGWVIESNATRILVDPLLTDSFDHADHPDVRFYPPRKLDLGAMPPVDAVVFSHEHLDHINISSLIRLDRRIPCYLSGRASVSARQLLGELGFQVSLLHSGEATAVGDIEIHPFHCVEITRDEWDVVPLLIRDRGGHGSLATSVDAPESSEFARFVSERFGPPSLWASTRNQVDLFPLERGRRQQDSAAATKAFGDMLLRFFATNFPKGAEPTTLALLDDGFVFAGELAWLNRHVFPARIDDVAASVAERLPRTTVRRPKPGHRFIFEAKRLVGEETSQSFMEASAVPEWMVRESKPLDGPVPDYPPATGRREFSTEDLGNLLSELERFAAYLYGRDLHRALYSRGTNEAVGFVLRTEGEPITLRYRPESCSFEQAPGEALVAGMECWATDLLDALRFDFVMGNVVIGRYRKWNEASGHLPCHLDAELVFFTHPLRQPARTLEMYRKIIRAVEGEAGPVIRYAGG